LGTNNLGRHIVSISVLTIDLRWNQLRSGCCTKWCLRENSSIQVERRSGCCTKWCLRDTTSSRVERTDCCTKWGFNSNHRFHLEGDTIVEYLRDERRCQIFGCFSRELLLDTNPSDILAELTFQFLFQQRYFANSFSPYSDG